MHRFLPLVLLLLVAAERRVGNLVFDLPAGAELDTVYHGVDDVPLLVIDDGDRETHDVALAGGSAVEGGLAGAKSWAEGRVRGLQERGHVVEFKGWQDTPHPGGEAALGYATVHDDDGDPAGMAVALVFHAAGRADLIVSAVPVVGRGPEALEAFQADTRAAMTTLATVGDSVRLASAGAGAGLLPPARPGPLDGFYWGQTMRISGGGTTPLNTHFTRRKLNFYPDGRFTVGLPPGGRDAFAAADFDARAADATDRVGRYAVDGRTLTLHLATGETDTLTLNPEGTLADGDMTLHRTIPVADGSRLDLTRDHFSYHGYAAAFGASAGGGRSERTVFRPDGTFTADETDTFTHSQPMVFVDKTGRRRTAGTYEVRGGELSLALPDGTTHGVEIFWLDENPDEPGMSLWIDDEPIDDPEVLPPAAAPAANPLDRPANPLDGPANPLDAAGGDVDARSAGTGLDGVFYRTEMQTMILPSGSQFFVSAEILNLLPGGHYTLGLPPGGRGGFAELPADERGTYRVDGDRLVMTGADGEVTTATLDADRDVITEDGGGQLVRSGLLPDGFRFDAEEATSQMHFAGDSGANPDVSVGVTAGTTFSRVFSTDGTFTEGSSRTASTSTRGPAHATGTHRHDETTARGRYEVRDGLVHLSYDDGRRDSFEVLWLPPEPGDTDPPIVWANGGFDMEFATPLPAAGDGPVNPLDR